MMRKVRRMMIFIKPSRHKNCIKKPVIVLSAYFVAIASAFNHKETDFGLETNFRWCKSYTNLFLRCKCCISTHVLISLHANSPSSHNHDHWDMVARLFCAGSISHQYFAKNVRWIIIQFLNQTIFSYLKCFYTCPWFTILFSQRNSLRFNKRLCPYLRAFNCWGV